MVRAPGGCRRPAQAARAGLCPALEDRPEERIDEDALAHGTATLEGMAQLYRWEGASVRLCSTAYQWRQIVGGTLDVVPGASPVVGGILVGLPSWLAGASDAQDARRRCVAEGGLTGGPVVMVQHIVGDLDHDESCV